MQPYRKMVSEKARVRASKLKLAVIPKASKAGTVLIARMDDKKNMISVKRNKFYR